MLGCKIDCPTSPEQSAINHHNISTVFFHMKNFPQLSWPIFKVIKDLSQRWYGNILGPSWLLTWLDLTLMPSPLTVKYLVVCQSLGKFPSLQFPSESWFIMHVVQTGWKENMKVFEQVARKPWGFRSRMIMSCIYMQWFAWDISKESFYVTAPGQNMYPEDQSCVLFLLLQSTVSILWFSNHRDIFM